MKKREMWIALLALALAALLPCAAQAAEGDANVARYDDLREEYEDSVQGACVMGDTLYLNGNAHIFRYRVGDGDLTAMELELPEGAEDESRGVDRLFSDGERLYVLSSVYKSTENAYGLDRLEILPIELDGDAARAGEGVRVNLDELVTDYGSGESRYLVQINDACYVGGYLMLNVYDPSSQLRIYALDVASGEGAFLEGPEDPGSMTPYDGDRLLISTVNYGDRTAEFWIYDPASESLSAACAPVALGEDDMYEFFGGLTYSAESGRLFYLSGGYVMAMEDFDYAGAQPVAELSTFYGERRGGLLLPGDYFVNCSSESTLIRSTAPGALPEVQLVVQGLDYSESVMDAYYGFGSAHPGVAVVLDPDYVAPEALIEAMMNRDDSVDVYMISVNSEAFDALYNRGYMVELENEEVASAVEGMYPAFQEVLTRDGSVVAVPVMVYGWSQGLDYEGFEKIGIPREDVPTTWKGLLELLPQLPAMLPEDGSVRIFNEYETQESVRTQLLAAILESWRVQLTASGQDLRYDDPALIELMDSVLALDLGALGLPEEEDGEGGYSYSVALDGERNYQLIEFSSGCTPGGFYGNVEPVSLSALPGEEGYIALSVRVAFVNPFSKNVDLAQEFLVEVLRCLDVRTAYSLSDERNEPVRNENALEYIESEQERLDQLRADLETAEPVDKPALEEEIASEERIIAEMDRYSWTISEWEITWYRAHAGRLTVQRFDYMDAADEDGELSDMAEQLLAGRVTPEEFLREVDRKVRMRQMEGN